MSATTEATQAIKPIAVEAAALQDTVDGFVITDAESEAQLADLVKELRQRGKALDDSKKAITKPLNASMLLDAILVAQGKEALTHRLRQSADVSQEYSQLLAGAHVLLVEDNDINQELALELLEGAGMTVDVANHGYFQIVVVSVKAGIVAFAKHPLVLFIGPIGVVQAMRSVEVLAPGNGNTVL